MQYVTYRLRPAMYEYVNISNTTFTNIRIRMLYSINYGQRIKLFNTKLIYLPLILPRIQTLHDASTVYNF